MVEETQEPAGDQTGPEGGDTRPAKKTRAARPADAPRAAGGMPPIIGTALAAAILLLAGGGTFAGGYFTNAAVDDDGGGGTAAAPTAAATVVAPATPTPPVVADVSVDDDPSWGPEDAAVTIVEFSDFQ